MLGTLARAAIAALSIVATVPFAAAQDDAPVAAAFLPADVSIAIGLRDGDRHVAAFRTLLDDVGFESSDAYRAFFRTPQAFAARIGLGMLAASAGTDEWGAIAAAAGRDLAIGIRWRDEPGAVAVLVPRDATTVELLVEGVTRFAGAQPDDPIGGPDERPVTVTSVRGRAFVARCGGAILVATDRDALADAIAAGCAREPSFATTEAHETVTRTVPADAAAWAWADVATIRARLERSGRWPTRIPQPLGAFVAGGWWHHLSTTDRAIAWARPDAPRRLAIEARVDGTPMPETHRGFVEAGAPAWSARAIPGYVGELSLTRDWATLLSNREALLDRAGAGALAKFLTNAGNFLGDLDLVDDVLPHVRGGTRVVAAEQAFDATPTPALPAFALVAPLADADDRLARQLEKAAQVAFTFINYQAMQQKRPTFMMDTGRYRDHRVLSTFFDETPESPTIRFNFQPAVARIADHYVISTSRTLLERVADRILDATRTPSRTPPVDRLAIDGAPVARLLRLNRDQLIANRMLDEGVDRRSATRTIDGAVAFVDFLGRAVLTATADDEDTRLTLTVDVVAPPRTKTPPPSGSAR